MSEDITNIQPDERSGLLWAQVDQQGDYRIGHYSYPRMTARVEPPCKPLYERGYYFNRDTRPLREWEPEHDEVQMPNIRVELGHNYEVDGDRARAMSEVIAVAAELYDGLLLGCEAALTDQAKRKQAIIDKDKLEREEKERAKNELKELLQNYIGTNFKLKRDGYKATVFGVVDRLDERTLYTTSERGVRMTTVIADINFFAVKWEGERRYETIYDRKAVVS